MKTKEELEKRIEELRDLIKECDDAISEFNKAINSKIFLKGEFEKLNTKIKDWDELGEYSTKKHHLSVELDFIERVVNFLF